MLQLTQLTGFNARRGSLHKRGSGTAGILLDAAGVGVRHLVGAGAAPFTIGAAGIGSSAGIHAGIGTASITLDASGIGARHQVGGGSAAITIAAAGVGSVPAPPAPPATAPSHWWSMDEPNFYNNRADSAGSLTLVPHLEVAASNPSGSAIVGAGMLVNSGGGFDFAGSWTLTGWMMLSQSANDGNLDLLLATNSTDATQVEAKSEASGFHVRLGGSRSSVGDVLVENEWCFIAATFDEPGNVLKLYQNGVLKSTSSSGAKPTGTFGGVIHIGTATSVPYKYAYVDAVALFAAVLTLAEVEWLYNSGAGRSYGEF